MVPPPGETTILQGTHILTSHVASCRLPLDWPGPCFVTTGVEAYQGGPHIGLGIVILTTVGTWSKHSRAKG